MLVYQNHRSLSLVCLALTSHKTVHNSLSLPCSRWNENVTSGFIFSSKVKSLYKDESAKVCVFQQHSKLQRWYQWHEKYHTYYFTSINIQRTIYSTQGPGERGWEGGRLPCILYGRALKVRLLSRNPLSQHQQHVEIYFAQGMSRTKPRIFRWNIAIGSSNTKCQVKLVAPRGNLIKIASNQY